jgi:hypothetical protein
MTWSRRFADPIPLRDGRALVTLRHAGEYIAMLQAKEQQQDHWRTAVEALLAAKDGGIVMLADIAVRKALAPGQPKLKPQARKKRTTKYRLATPPAASLE